MDAVKDEGDPAREDEKDDKKIKLSLLNIHINAIECMCLKCFSLSKWKELRALKAKYCTPICMKGKRRREPAK